MKGLRLDKSGAAPQPSIWTFAGTTSRSGFSLCFGNPFFQFRKFSDLSVASFYAGFWLVGTPDRLKKPGPCGVLAARLTSLGWTYVQHFKFLDQDGETD